VSGGVLTGKVEVKDLVLLIETLTQVHHSSVSEIVVGYYLRRQLKTGSIRFSLGFGERIKWTR